MLRLIFTCKQSIQFLYVQVQCPSEGLRRPIFSAKFDKYCLLFFLHLNVWDTQVKLDKKSTKFKNQKQEPGLKSNVRFLLISPQTTTELYYY